MERKRPDPYKLRRLRQVVQFVFLFIFTFPLIKALFGQGMGSWIPLIVFSLITLVLTLVLGRVWCGWVCPMGTILYWTRFKGAMERGARSSNRWRMVKFAILFLILAAIFLGLLNPALGWMGSNRLISGIIIGFVLIFSIGLNYFADLFWCRYLCPLGAAVGLVSKIAPMRRIVRSHCNDCSVCVDACQMGAIDPRRGFVSDPGECTVCIDCLTSCTSSSNGFQFSPPFGEQR